MTDIIISYILHFIGGFLVFHAVYYKRKSGDIILFSKDFWKIMLFVIAGMLLFKYFA